MPRSIQLYENRLLSYSLGFYTEEAVQSQKHPNSPCAIPENQRRCRYNETRTFQDLVVCREKEQVQATSLSQEDEVLNLQPGELVEVKSFREIAKTFDKNQRCKGLYFMGEMRQFCGRQFRVFKRVNRILLESTGEIRKVKNTVLLGDVVCDGHVWYDCDRSCFYYWREAWLERVEEKSE